MEKYVLITGASSGIGYEFAKIFARENYNLILTARSEEKLDKLRNEILSMNKVSIVTIGKDLSNPTAAEEIYKEVSEKKLEIDILVNNAGFGTYGKFIDANPEKEIDMINLNIISLVKLTHLFLQDMKKMGKGKILNIASTAAFQPGPLMAVYYATKSFVLHFSEAIDEELLGSGITITTLCPGPTESGFQEAAQITQSKLVKGRKLPTSKEVAEFGYRKLMKGKRVAIHGKLNFIIANLIRFTPRNLVTKVVKFIQNERKV